MLTITCQTNENNSPEIGNLQPIVNCKIIAMENTINTLTTELNETIEQKVNTEFKKQEMSKEYIIGALVHGFEGIGMAVPHSRFKDSDDACATDVINSLIVHFLSEGNREQLPESVRSEVLDTLTQFGKMIRFIAANGNLMFECANLYRVANWSKQSAEVKHSIEDWYE